MSRIALLRARDDTPSPWEHALSGLPSQVLGPDSTPVRSALEGISCIMVDGGVEDALGRIRRAHRVDPAIQAIVVAPEEIRRKVERAILLTPGVGEVWMVPPEDVHPALVERADAVTGKRRAYRGIERRVALDLAGQEPQRAQRAVVSDAYLAALLEATPDPVVSIDASGEVLSWNPGAERALGYPRSEAIERPLSSLLTPAGCEAAPAITDPPQEPTRGEISFRTRQGETRIAELTVLPVQAAGQRVWAVILHDLTEERRAQEEIEVQAAELHAQAAMLLEQAALLEEHTAELEATNEALRRAMAELERASGARDRFYAAMSHELRTPINAIIGYNGLLLSGVYGPLEEKQEQGIGRAQRAAQHLHELVDDVLDLAKIEAGRIELQLEPVALPLAIEELLDTVRSFADQHGSQLSVRGEGSRTIESDPRRLRQILLNLLSNAIKFGEGEPIEVRWRSDEAEVVVEVVDRGVGIASEDHERIFEEFTQADGGPEGGTGLGLPISRRLAVLLGGTLELTSKPGEGSTFRLRLPHRVPDAQR